MGTSTKGIPVNLYLTPADRQTLHTFFDNAVNGIAEIPESFIRPLLFRTLNSENIGTLLINNNPVAKYCRDRTAEETCAKEHLEGPIVHDGNGHEDNGNGNVTGTNVSAITTADIPTYIAKLISEMPSPDSVLNPVKIPSRPNQDLIAESVEALSLKKGPAETAAYYDFHSLQIAFEHIWQQLFDEDIVNIGYNLQKKVLQQTGINPTAEDRYSYDNLKALAQIALNTPLAQVPANVSCPF